MFPTEVSQIATFLQTLRAFKLCLSDFILTSRLWASVFNSSYEPYFCSLWPLAEFFVVLMNVQFPQEKCFLFCGVQSYRWKESAQTCWQSCRLLCSNFLYYFHLFNKVMWCVKIELYVVQSKHLHIISFVYTVYYTKSFQS